MIFGNLDIEIIVLLIPALIFSLSFHEFAHAWMAFRLGDDTAAKLGRLTLNPMAHLDPVGSIALLLMGFGWAKPVPVDVRYLRNPKEDMVKVAAAGPISNLLLAVIAALCLRLLFGNNLLTGSIKSFIVIFMQINITLAIFNLLPVSPLDGSQILSPFIEKKFGIEMVYKMEMYGPRVLFFIIIFSMVTGIHLFSFIINPIFNLFLYIFF
ncbi:site-2 protease family protein [Candidatus Marinimicrobia bacterium]|nr:site-2 protease family protein [Candidatus Neomarinimicrobiota bacterium]